jgi:hypothetical protein
VIRIFAFAATIVLLLPHAAGATDWQNGVSHIRPGKIAAETSFRGEYDVGWSAIRAGRATVELSRSRGNSHLDIDAATVGFARTLWRFDVHHSADAESDSLRPRRVEQVEKYKGETVAIRLQFDRQGVTQWRVEEPAHHAKNKPKRFDLPGLFDIQTALLWIRSQPLATGDVYRFVIFPGSTPYLAEATVLGSARVHAAGRDWNARKLSLALRRIDRKTMRLLPHRSFRSAHAWFSDDDRRLLLEARAEIFIGSVWMELKRISDAGR